MQFSQSRLNSRGALIAVIKIQIDTDRVDRIFLHQNDDDYRLAEDFVEKHRLNYTLVNHIFERIKFSRKSVESKDNKDAQAVTHPSNQMRNADDLDIKHSYRKDRTPYQNLTSNRQQILYSEEQSFGNNKINANGVIQDYYPSLFRNEEDIVTGDKQKKIVNYQQLLEAPVKKLFQDDKQFLIYEMHRENQEEEGNQVNPFPKQLCASENKQLFTSTANNFHSKYLYATDTEQKRPKKIQQIIQLNDIKQHLKAPKSMMKLRGNADQQKIQHITKGLNRDTTQKTLKRDYSKPTHVKIFKKQEMQSLNQSLKKSTSRQQISRINKDVTRRLYNEADIKKNYLNLIKEKARKEKQITEDPELTHHPQINKISKVIAEGRRNQIPIEMHLIQYGKKAEFKKQEEANKRILKQVEHCTFEPELNIISQRLASDREKLLSRISEGKSRRSKYANENQFHPTLNKVTQQLMRDKGTFYDRQRQYLQQKNSRLVEKVKEKHLKEKIDLITGQLLFKPKINDLGIRESQGSNIGNYLYELSKINNECSIAASNRPKINDYSENLVQQMQSKRITWIFSEMDHDQDGLISAQKISLDSISPELLNIIKPILFEMEELNEQLSLPVFRSAIDILHKKLTTFQRSILYNYKQKAK